MKDNPIVIWAGAILLVVGYFYAMDHFVMGIQGLPVNMMLGPAQ